MDQNEFQTLVITRLDGIEAKFAALLDKKAGNVLGDWIEPTDDWGQTTGRPAKDVSEALMFVQHGFRPLDGTCATWGLWLRQIWGEIRKLAALSETDYSAYREGLFAGVDREIAAGLLLLNRVPMPGGSIAPPSLAGLKGVLFAEWLAAIMHGEDPLRGPSGE